MEDADTTLLLAGDGTECPPCLFCGEGVSDVLGGLWSLPGIDAAAAPGMIHDVCAVMELARIRTPEFLAKQNTTDDLAALVRQLVRQIHKADPHNACAERAIDYLKRKGLQGSPLR